jgi:hypothetical protein
VRQLAAAFNKEVKNMDFERYLKAAASCRTQRRPLGAVLLQKVCGISRLGGAWIEEFLYGAMPRQSAGETPALPGS